MRPWFFAVCAFALVISGCVTTPPRDAVIGSALPKIDGSESSYTGTGDPGAHAWTDDQARTALWLRRNFPERWGEIPFAFINFFSYNIHNDRQQLMPFEFEYYFANLRDPYLQVRMFTLEARDRNRARRNEVTAKKAAEQAAAEQAITGEVTELTDREVATKLETVFP